uniref:Uncharacterized protein n=1 Tax=Arundo donax TaxID=35708 RepID=A0A0A9AJR0_ARUDO
MVTGRGEAMVEWSALDSRAIGAKSMCSGTQLSAQCCSPTSDNGDL